MSESPCKITVVIDMGFEDLMNQRDLGKCLKQLLHCYSMNRRLENPLQFHITSFDGERLKEEMNRHQGYENWDCHFHTKCYSEVFSSENIVKVEKAAYKTDKTGGTCESPKLSIDNTESKEIRADANVPTNSKNIIYLTSESDNILESFDPNCAYIIGGLVDHNQHKGLCHRLATEKGVNHARLPIQEVGVEMKTRQVLTIDHVFRIISLVASEGKSWKEALIETLPERKGAKDVYEINKNISQNECENENTADENGNTADEMKIQRMEMKVEPLELKWTCGRAPAPSKTWYGMIGRHGIFATPLRESEGNLENLGMPLFP